MSRICSLRQVIYYDSLKRICGELNFHTQSFSVETLYAQAHHQLHSYSHVLTLNRLIIKNKLFTQFQPTIRIAENSAKLFIYSRPWPFQKENKQNT